MAYKYCVAENWGKGFIDHSESATIGFAGFPGNVWRIPANNKAANLWVFKVAGSFKTKEEAQAIVDAEVATAQANWDALPEEQKANSTRPENIVLE
jgi:hypothetical protein